MRVDKSNYSKEAFEFVYGPVYQSLPDPLKELSVIYKSVHLAAPSAAEFKQHLFQAFSAQLQEYLDARPSLPAPDDGGKIARSLAYYRVLRLEHIAVIKALQGIKGVGPAYAPGIIISTAEATKKGYTPGDYLINHSEQMYTDIASRYKRINQQMSRRRPDRPNLNPLTRTVIKNLREWWLENGGSA
jgi:hypothetical protein